MNDAKSMLMMYSYSYAAMKAAEDKEETKTKAAKDTKQSKTKRRGNNNDKGTERADSTITEE